MSDRDPNTMINTRGVRVENLAICSERSQGERPYSAPILVLGSLALLLNVTRRTIVGISTFSERVRNVIIPEFEGQEP